MKQWNCRALEEEEKDDLLAKAELCRLAMAAEGQPYLLPVAVQTQKDETGEWTFRIQSPVYGMKMEYLKANRRVALEFEGSSAEGTDSVVAFGIASRVSKNAVDAARAKGIKVGMIRPITLWPFPDKVLKAAAQQCKSFLTVELNMGQMIKDVKLAIECQKPVGLCYRTGGMIPSPEEVLAAIENMQKEGK